jgi:hypothetical protein
MITLLMISMLFVALHFIYESIILPGIRQQLRFRLFRARDALRNLKIEHSKQVSDSAFNYLDEAISAQLTFQHRLSLLSAAEIELRARRDPEFANRCKERFAKIERCELRAFKEIEIEVVRCFVSAIAAGSGLLMVILSPIIFFTLLTRKAKKWLSDRRSYAAISERDLEIAAPC